MIISNQNITSLIGIDFSEGIESLDCSNNPLTSLKGCPKSIKVLICDFTLITSLKYCTKEVKELHCSNTLITSLKYSPKSLKILWCHNSPIKTLEHCPSLTNLSCDGKLFTRKLQMIESLTLYNFRVSNKSTTRKSMRIINKINPTNIQTFLYISRINVDPEYKCLIIHRQEILEKKKTLKIDNYRHILKVVKLTKIKRIIYEIWNKYWYDELIHDEVNRFCIYSVYSFR